MSHQSREVICLLYFKADLKIFLNESGYPRLSQLMDYNARGTVQLMHDFNATEEFNAIEAYQVTFPMKIPHQGSDNLKTWAEFKPKIVDFITRICKNSKLPTHSVELCENAIKVLSDHLWREYFKLFPYWPSVNSENDGQLDINFTHIYNCGDTIVMWNCLGQISVKDTRPDGDFRASLAGSPEIKVILAKRRLLSLLENKMKMVTLDDAKGKVDRKLTELDWSQI